MARPVRAFTVRVTRTHNGETETFTRQCSGKNRRTALRTIEAWRFHDSLGYSVSCPAPTFTYELLD